MPHSDDMIAKTQIPADGSISLDHVTHVVPDSDTAAAALGQLGFTLTPFSPQLHRLEPGGPLLPAGTGNQCVMLKRGYIEFLAPIADTPRAQQLRTAIKRYVGVHQIALGTARPDAEQARLKAEGFDPLPPVALERPVEVEGGAATARFTVVRLPFSALPEGRILFCAHHTPELLWQRRWIAHANHATALTAAIVCVARPAEAAARYARLTGQPAGGSGDARHVDIARGRLVFCSPEMMMHGFSIVPPSLPWMAGSVLATSNISASYTYFERAGFAAKSLGNQRFAIALPDAVGGFIAFEPEGSPPFTMGS
jgi:hypothetical protein